jgi:putative N-acetylmannosamine-6-phosphate epimerase
VRRSPSRAAKVAAIGECRIIVGDENLEPLYVEVDEAVDMGSEIVKIDSSDSRRVRESSPYVDIAAAARTR